MNETIKLLTQHATHRHFKPGLTLPEAHVDAILAALQQAPSWMNGQHYSVIAIDDPSLKAQLLEWSPRNAQFGTSSLVLLFLLDLTKQEAAAAKHGQPFDVVDSAEVLLTAATDAALAMENAALASESLGYGTVCTGGVRNMADKLIALFNLPQYVYPLCALCIGTVDKAQEVERIKPRFEVSAKVGRNAYAPASREQVDSYDKTMADFAEARETVDWSVKFANYYRQKPNVNTDKWLKEQGF